MSKGREISDYLDDILTAITDTAEFTKGMSYEMFAADKRTINAVIRCLEVLGEAAKHIPASFRKNIPIFPGLRWLACGMFSFTITWEST
jgi:uncharacterized protein with HEPN domain